MTRYFLIGINRFRIYIMRKELDADKTSDILEKLSLIFTIPDLKSFDLMIAVKLWYLKYSICLK